MEERKIPCRPFLLVVIYDAILLAFVRTWGVCIFCFVRGGGGGDQPAEAVLENAILIMGLQFLALLPFLGAPPPNKLSDIPQGFFATVSHLLQFARNTLLFLL